MTFRSLLLSTLASLLFVAFGTKASASQHAVIETSYGPIVVELDEDKAPISVANFEAYAENGFYTNTVFHRVIPGFMIQGGGFDHHGNYPAGLHNKSAHQTMLPPIVNEWKNGLKNVRGSIAMARLGGKVDSATSQFFINLKDNGFLDQPRDGAAYAVFGKVIAGMDVVDRIAAVPTGNFAGMGDVPAQEVTIRAVRILPLDEAMSLAAQAEIKAAEARVESARDAVSDSQAELESAIRDLEELKKKAAAGGE